jgi:hypothetical protein
MTRNRMKTLASPADKEEILARLCAIRPESPRRWGRMNAHQMICHVSDALRVGMGGKAPKPIGGWASRTLVKWAALWLPVHWPRGVPTVPECEAGVGGTPPAEMARDLSELRQLLDRFTSLPHADKLPPHPIFGKMSEREWMRWGYLHIDHHLRQFGA